MLCIDSLRIACAGDLHDYEPVGGAYFYKLIADGTHFFGERINENAK